MVKSTKKPARAKAGATQGKTKAKAKPNPKTKTIKPARATARPGETVARAKAPSDDVTMADVIQVFAEAFAAIVSQIDAQGPDRRSGQALGQAESLTRAIQERLVQRLGAPPSAAQLQVLGTLSGALAAAAPKRQAPAAEAPGDSDAHEAYVQWHLEMFGRPPTGRR